MPRYAITERAGPFVAGIRNTGVGTVLELTERQAEHELRLGTLIRLSATDDLEWDGAQAEQVEVADAVSERGITVVSAGDTDVPLPSRKPRRPIS